MGVLNAIDCSTESKLGAMSAEELEAMRELCTAYWVRRPRDSWNVIVTKARRPIFEALRDAGFIDLSFKDDGEGVAAIKPERIDVCVYLIGPQATR